MLDIGFDIISDLNLEPNDNFNWEDKATSLYCILSGNISSDVQTMVNVLSHLSRFYQGVFYTPGLLEYDSSPLQNINQRTADIQNISKKLPNVILLHHNIVIIDGIAIVGANCWENAHEPGKSISIDELVMNYKLRPKFIKIDVEGAEFSVLQGMTNVLEKYSPSIMIEKHPTLIPKILKISEIDNFLIKKGYKVDKLIFKDDVAITEIWKKSN